ncbi:MAG: hypothetical protein AAF969_13035 [Bacteroidota bacterium]
MRYWIKHIIEGSIYQGLEVFEDQGKISYAFLSLQKQRGELHVRKESIYDCLDKVADAVSKNSPLMVSLNTSSILGKDVDHWKEIAQEQLVIRAFPNLDLDNFHYQLLGLNDTTRVFICQKKYFNEFLNELAQFDLFPAQIEIGASPLQHILGHLQNTELIGSTYKLTREGMVVGFDSARGGSIHLGGLELKPESLTSFAQILGFIEAKRPIGNFGIYNDHLLNDFKNKRLFHFGLRLGLGVFLVILLVNFVFFTSYQDQITELEANAPHQHDVNSVRSLEGRVADKKLKLSMVLETTGSKSSYYLDRIASEIPNTILLTELIYQPPIRPVRKDKLIELDENIVRLAGVAQNKLEFTQWTGSLEQKNWVERVEIEAYDYVSSLKSQFVIKAYLDEIEQKQ